jgi:hypothetical protein
MNYAEFNKNFGKGIEKKKQRLFKKIKIYLSQLQRILAMPSDLCSSPSPIKEVHAYGDLGSHAYAFAFDNTTATMEYGANEWIQIRRGSIERMNGFQFKKRRGSMEGKNGFKFKKYCTGECAFLTALPQR